MTAEVLLLSDPAMIEHDPGPGHPECPQRLVTVCDTLRTQPVAGTRWATPQPAPRSVIERIHAPAYVDRLHELRGTSARLDADTLLSPGSIAAAWLAAGAAVDAVTAVISGRARRAVALVRPPGHHAEADRAMGFCLFNNIAIAAAHARVDLGCRRVLIVDWDVHHGNGTQHAFFDRSDVLFFSTHRFPFWPGTGDLHEIGADAGIGFTVNVPLPVGCGDTEYRAVFDKLLVPVADDFEPELILVSAGFDAHERDPLGGMSMTTAGYGSLSGVVCELADRLCDGRLVLILEGGYDLEALAGSVRACVNVLAGPPPPVTPAPSEPQEVKGSEGSAERAIDEVRQVHRGFWPLQ